MASQFKIRCSVLGHEKDVRAVIPALYPENGIVSASRDITSRVWMPNENGQGFTEAHVMSGHNKFVSSVCLMPPDDKHPQGLIVTGSNDHMIHAYTLSSPMPLYKLEGHSNTVCSLAAGKFGTLISGSWDQTARVWLNQKCLMTLTGHTAAVWSVAILPEGGFMLTGSADKSIKMWKAGKCEVTFKGHADCVRGLAVLSTTEFLSCSNDATVRRWLTTGECLHVFYGHTNYVYGVALMPNGSDFVSVGEDRTLRVWKGEDCAQVIAHPTQSVWCVTVLANGDIVTGASDSVIRVFTCDPSRQASAPDQKAYEELLASTEIPAQVGDIPADQLSGPEALLNPGKRDGQHVMIKESAGIIMYQWSAADNKWTKIGDVVGGSGGSQGSSGKQLYEGKEYDYVFDVDIQEGLPALKLPFNLTEDPYMAAHNWLDKNEISQLYLDQVAQFIMEQTKGATIQPVPSGLVDPLTGAGRYVPSSEGSSSSAVGAGGSDPFTGGGRYKPTYDNQSSGGGQHGADPFTGSSSYKPAGSSSSASSANTFFPKKDFVGFDQANVTAILTKLKEFNSQADPNKQLSEQNIAELEGLMMGKAPLDGQLQHLWDLLLWPAGVLFPVLDVVRLAVRTPAVARTFCNDKDSPMFTNLLMSCITQSTTQANQMLALRILCNLFRNEEGIRLIVTQRESITSAILQASDKANKNTQIAAASVLLNYSVVLGMASDAEAKSHCVAAAVTLSEKFSDPEAMFRLLVCLGTLMCNDEQCASFSASLGVAQFVNRCKLVGDPPKVAQCAGHLENRLKS